MCGIFGMVRSDGAVIGAGVRETMQRALAHRGPDHHGYLQERGLLLGMNRLAVLDLATGNQPLYNRDRTLAMVFNGEIYNYRELRSRLEKRGRAFTTSSDTETVLQAFEEYGERCLDSLNGMFAFAIWDRVRRRLFVARDRLGIKPLYLARTREAFAFASEAKALAGLLSPARPDWTALGRYFSLGYLPAPHSPFAGIEKLMPGTWGLLEEDGSWKTRSYWAPSYGNGDETSLARACARVEELLEKAVEQELVSDVPLGLLLSGGLDSSAVALYARKRSGPGLRSFAVSFEEQSHDESADARLAARHLGLEHSELLFTGELLRSSLSEAAAVLDEPFGDCTVLPLLAVSRLAREQVKVVLTGWGGDEVFAGYPTYRAHLWARRYRRLPDFLARGLIPAAVERLPVSRAYLSFDFKARRFVKGMDLPPELQHFLWMGYHDEQAKRRLLTPEILARMEEPLREVAEVAATLAERDLISRIQHLDARYFLEGNGLFQADRMTMAASLEARVPLLNLELIEYVNALPVSLKMPGGRLKGLLKRVLAPHLPPRIVHKPKKGFGPPASAWMRGGLGDLFRETFSRERVEGQGIFRYRELSRLLAEHREGRADHGRNLWSLLSFQLWYDSFWRGGGHAP